MQSMEDLLEREIRDIKRKASALSSRFGLPVAAAGGGAAAADRARSEPPLIVEEGLYRAKSCPGIAHGGEGRSLPRTESPPGASAFTFPHVFISRNGSSKRFSCSALDFLMSKPSPHFEASCPDVREAGAPRTRGGGSPSASFIRLLKVS